MGEFLKKQWAVLVVGIVFVGMICYVSFDSVTSKLPSKTANGKDVVFTINGNNVTADDLYEEMLGSTAGTAAVYNQFERAVINQAVADTDELKENAEMQATYIKSYYQSQYGTEGEKMLLNDLKSLGYSSVDQLYDYFLYYYKSEQFVAENVDAKLDELFPEFQAKKEPCIVSHILVKMADPANPTEEETAKMAAIDEALKTAEFGAVAAEYSEDGSAANNGILGYADADTSFVTEFMAEMLRAKVGEPTEWFASQFGYHKILVISRSLEDFKEYDEFNTAISNFYPTLRSDAVWAKAEELGVEFANEEMMNAVKKFMGLQEGANE